jgi:hypothetical protein
LIQLKPCDEVSVDLSKRLQIFKTGWKWGMTQFQKAEKPAILVQLSKGPLAALLSHS